MPTFLRCELLEGKSPVIFVSLGPRIVMWHVSVTLQCLDSNKLTGTQVKVYNTPVHADTQVMVALFQIF